MGKCVIFCAGDLFGPVAPISDDDLIIAADGGLRHAQALGLTPNAILGDFDSLGYVPQGAQVFPVEKDDTDTMLAIRHGLELGYKDFLLYGCTGGTRPDHTLANYQALCYLRSEGAWGVLADKDHFTTAISNEKLTFAPDATGYISLFCMGKTAHGVTLSGLQYPMENGTLQPDLPLGVSNRFIDHEASIEVKDGTLLVIWEKQNGLPVRNEL